MKNLLKPRYAISLLILLLIVAYSLYQARELIIGPRIWVESPVQDAVLTDSVLTIEGSSRNIAWISLNGRQIFIDEEGHFSEKLIVSPGVSIMTLEAKDRFGRETKETLRVILKE